MSFNKEDVWQAADEIERGGEQEMTVLPKLVLLAELMGKYGIERVRYVPGNGNCVGLLATEEERFWGPKEEVCEKRRLSVGTEENAFQVGRVHTPKAEVVSSF